MILIFQNHYLCMVLHLNSCLWMMGSKRGKKNATDRPKEKKREQNDFDSIFEPFDIDNSDYL